MKYFKVKELVPKEVYDVIGEDAIKLLDPVALEALENVREILGVPLICNNWASGGSRNNCGYRTPNASVGAVRSAHKEGIAFDLISPDMTAAEMREKLEKNQHLLKHPIRVEKWEGNKEITWLHIDTRDTKGQKLYFFRA